MTTAAAFDDLLYGKLCMMVEVAKLSPLLMIACLSKRRIDVL